MREEQQGRRVCGGVGWEEMDKEAAGGVVGLTPVSYVYETGVSKATRMMFTHCRHQLVQNIFSIECVLYRYTHGRHQAVKPKA